MAWNGDNNSYLEFIDRHSLTFDNLDDTAAVIFSEYDIPSQPAWVFLDQDGILETRLGAMSKDALVEILANL